MLKFFQSK